MAEHRVGSVGDIEEGSGIAVDVFDRRIAIFLYRGRYYALDETCPHRGAPLHEGCIEAGVVVCPWHQWQFSLEDGCSPVNPLSRVGCYAVRAEGNDLILSVE